MRCLKDTILKIITWLNFLSLLIFGCALDSDSWIPFIICCINIAWLALFGYANNWFEGWCDD